MDRLGQHLAHIIDQAGSKDNLKLVSGHKNPLDQIYIFNSRYICSVIVLQNQPQPCGTVGYAQNIVSSPGKPDNFRRYFFIALSFLSIHFLIPPI